MDNKNDVTKSVERYSLVKSYGSDKIFGTVDKAAHSISNVLSDIESEELSKNEIKNDSDFKEQSESRLQTSKTSNEDNPKETTNSKLKTGVNCSSQNEKFKDKNRRESTSKLKTLVAKGLTKIYGFNENQGKISKTVTAISKTGKGISKVSRTLTRVSKDLDRAISNDGTGKDYLKEKIDRQAKKAINKSVIKPIKKPIKKIGKKITSPITKLISSIFKIMIRKAIKGIICLLPAIVELVIPIAFIIIIIVIISSVFSWDSSTTTKYQTYMDTIQTSYDNEVDNFLKANPNGIVIGVRGRYGKVNWRVPFSIMQGLGASMSFDESERDLLEKFKQAGLFEKHEIIDGNPKTLIITNAGYEEYIEWSNKNFSNIKTFSEEKNVDEISLQGFSSNQLESIKTLYLSPNAFDDFDKKYADYAIKYGQNKIPRNLQSDNYNSKNILTKAGYKGQCTWYAYGRALESTNKKMPTGNARTWLASAVAKGYETGSYPAPNSVVVLAGRTYGHVAYVEAYDGEKITISEGNSSNPCPNSGSGCNQVEYAKAHANEMVRNKTYNSFIDYKKASKNSGLVIVGFIYLD